MWAAGWPRYNVLVLVAIVLSRFSNCPRWLSFITITAGRAFAFITLLYPYPNLSLVTFNVCSPSASLQHSAITPTCPCEEDFQGRLWTDKKGNKEAGLTSRADIRHGTNKKTIISASRYGLTPSPRTCNYPKPPHATNTHHRLQRGFDQGRHAPIRRLAP